MDVVDEFFAARVVTSRDGRAILLTFLVVGCLQVVDLPVLLLGDQVGVKDEPGGKGVPLNVEYDAPAVGVHVENGRVEVGFSVDVVCRWHVVVKVDLVARGAEAVMRGGVDV